MTERLCRRQGGDERAQEEKEQMKKRQDMEMWREWEGVECSSLALLLLVWFAVWQIIPLIYVSIVGEESRDHTDSSSISDFQQVTSQFVGATLRFVAPLRRRKWVVCSRGGEDVR
jgi:hypothetical protein